MWHVTHDTWHMGGGEVNILSNFQLPSSYSLWFMILWRFGGKGSLTHWNNESRACISISLKSPWKIETSKKVSNFHFARMYYVCEALGHVYYSLFVWFSLPLLPLDRQNTLLLAWMNKIEILFYNVCSINCSYFFWSERYFYTKFKWLQLIPNYFLKNMVYTVRLLDPNSILYFLP